MKWLKAWRELKIFVLLSLAQTSIPPRVLQAATTDWYKYVVEMRKKNGFPLLSLDSWRHKSLPPWAICWVISQQWMPINCIWELRWYIHYIHYRIWESIILQWDQHNSRLWHIRYLGNLLYCDNILFHW